MELLHLGENIVRLRRQEKMTQEELANLMGVSKSSVSKWETGATYPDIVFLPELANLFDVTLDELLGYEPQLSREQIRKIYNELSKEMSEGNRKEALQRYQDYLRRYQTCYPFLNQMAVLLLNHMSVYENKEELFELILGLCKRIQEKSKDASLMKDAVMMESMVNIQRNQPEAVLELLGEDIRPLQQDNELIAAAYQMMGNMEKAKEIIQVGIYQYLLFLIQDSMSYMMLNTDDSAMCDEIIRRITVVMDAFHVDKLHANTAASYTTACASVYAMRKDKERCLEFIEKFTELCSNDTLLELKGDAYFTYVDSWFENLELGPRTPRANQMVYSSLLSFLEDNPLFTFLHDEFRYQRCVERLKKKLGGK